MVSKQYARNAAQQLFEEERVKRGLTWEALGDLVGRSKSHVHDFINKPWPTLPTLEFVDALAAALNVSRDIARSRVAESAGYSTGRIELNVPEWLASAYIALGESDPAEQARLERLVRAFVTGGETAKPRQRAAKKK
jgi:hypothetical protein